MPADDLLCSWDILSILPQLPNWWDAPADELSDVLPLADDSGDEAQEFAPAWLQFDEYSNYPDDPYAANGALQIIIDLSSDEEKAPESPLWEIASNGSRKADEAQLEDSDREFLYVKKPRTK